MARDSNAEGKDKWKYILAPEGVRARDVVESYRSGLSSSLIKSMRSAEEDDTEGDGAKKTWSANEIAKLGKDQSTSHALRYSHIRLQSGEMRIASVVKLCREHWEGQQPTVGRQEVW